MYTALNKLQTLTYQHLHIHFIYLKHMLSQVLHRHHGIWILTLNNKKCLWVFYILQILLYMLNRLKLWKVEIIQYWILVPYVEFVVTIMMKWLYQYQKQ